MMRSLLVVSTDGLSSGVLGMKSWARGEATTGSAMRCKSRPLGAHLSSSKPRGAQTRAVGIGERESDA
jgi:hypothetical protein